MKLSPLQLLQEEFLSKYGLEPDQLEIDINIFDADPNLAHYITSDFGEAKHGENNGTEWHRYNGEGFSIRAFHKKEGVHSDPEPF